MLVVDLDETEARQISVTFDPIRMLAEIDTAAMNTLMLQLPSDENLSEALDRLFVRPGAPEQIDTEERVRRAGRRLNELVLAEAEAVKAGYICPMCAHEW